MQVESIETGTTLREALAKTPPTSPAPGKKSRRRTVPVSEALALRGGLRLDDSEASDTEEQTATETASADNVQGPASNTLLPASTLPTGTR